MANSTECEDLHNTEWAGKGALIQKSIENLVRSYFYPILQQPSQTHKNASTEPFSAALGAGGRCVILPLPWSWLIDLCFGPKKFCEELKKIARAVREVALFLPVSADPHAERRWHSCFANGPELQLISLLSFFWNFLQQLFYTHPRRERHTSRAAWELSNTFLLERHTGSNSSQIWGTFQCLYQLSSSSSIPHLQEHFHTLSRVLLQRMWSAICIHHLRVQAQGQSKISGDTTGQRTALGSPRLEPGWPALPVVGIPP